MKKLHLLSNVFAKLLSNQDAFVSSGHFDSARKTWAKLPFSKTSLRFSSKVLAAVLGTTPLLISAPTFAQNSNGYVNGILQYGQWENNDAGKAVGHRIPAITATSQGTIVTVADIRYDGLTGNTDVVDGANKVHQVHFGVKVSADGGNTWTSQQVVAPQNLQYIEGYISSDQSYLGYISDPAVVHDYSSGKTFIFGYTNDRHVNGTNAKQPGDDHLVMFTSEDGGYTWDTGRDLTKSITMGDGYYHLLQGPGSGMYYKGTTYVAIQQWGTGVVTSGFIYSSDGGKTWQTSRLIIPDSSQLDAANQEGKYLSSESSIFYHKGEIYLAAKADQAISGVGRLLYKTNDMGKTWTRVKEDYLPGNVTNIETSSHALNEDLYFVGYSVSNSNALKSRDESWLTTNTGYRIKLIENPQGYSNTLGGYTSVTSDANNIYVFYEGVFNPEAAGAESSSLWLKRFDYAAREYASLGVQDLDRARSQFYNQNALFTDSSYIRASYGSRDEGGIEGVFAYNKLRIGLMAQHTTDIHDDVSGTIGYDEDNYNLLVGFTGFALDNDLLKDGIYVGYQSSDVKFDNGAKDKVQSLMAGYRLNLTSDYVDYSFAFNAMFSSHDFSRNNFEGLGKTASFNSKTFGLKNEVSKTLTLDEESKLSLKPYAGLNNIYFTHDAFTESYANGFNEVTVDKLGEWSHELYVGANLSAKPEIASGIPLNLEFDARYIKELSDQDKWGGDYEIFGTTMHFATPVEKHESGRIEAMAKAQLLLNDHAIVGVQALYDMDREFGVLGTVGYQF